MPKPGSAFFLAADQSDPITTAMAEALPYVRITLHPPGLLWRFKGRPSSGADAMGKAFVVPERRILQNQPAAFFAYAAPALSFVAVTAYILRRVEVTFKSKILNTRDIILIFAVEIL